MSQIRTLKPKKCAVGKETFQPIRPFQKTCFEHAGEYVKILNQKKLLKKQRAQRRVMRENIKTHSDWLKELQILVNKHVRIRDTGKNCVSCNTPDVGVKRDASHFWSQGGNPSVRFDLDNIHSACVYCNRDLHGNLLEYRPRLIERIGRKRFDELEQRRNTPLKLSIPEIQELITTYKRLLK